MQVNLRDVPDVLFDKMRWRDFCGRFASKEAALAAISRPPYGRYGFHGDAEDGVPGPHEDRNNYAEATFKLGKDLVGGLKHSLVSGVLKSAGVAFRRHYYRGEERPVDIASEEWVQLWPEFIENRAVGNGRYEQVRISWDARGDTESKALEEIISQWLLNDCPDADILKKAQVRAAAYERFGPVPIRLFDRAYKRAFNRKRGAPRRSK